MKAGKWFEIRDVATFIPVFCFEVSALDGFLARRAGFGLPLVCMYLPDRNRCSYDAFSWGSARTLSVAHSYIQEHWSTLEDSEVIDVEYILKESPIKKRSENFYDVD